MCRKTVAMKLNIQLCIIHVQMYTNIHIFEALCGIHIFMNDLYIILLSTELALIQNASCNAVNPSSGDSPRSDQRRFSPNFVLSSPCQGEPVRGTLSVVDLGVPCPIFPMSGRTCEGDTFCGRFRCSLSHLPHVRENL